MWQLVAAFADIAMLRRGPDSLPDSGFLVAFVIIADFIVFLVELGFYGGIDPANVLLFAIEKVLLLSFTYVVLAFFRVERRFRQTATAILGADFFISLLFLPFAVAAAVFGADLPSEPMGLTMLRLVSLLWLAYVSAAIMARSLSRPLLVGLLLEILYICLSLIIAVSLVGDVNNLNPPSS